MDQKYDNRLFSILEEVKSLPNFLDVVFGFLSRRTDFFEVATDPVHGIGLPKGVAQKFLRQAFEKYEKQQDIVAAPPAPPPPPIKNDVVQEKKDKDKSATNVQLLSSYNGSVFENYSWSQSISDVDVQIKIPDQITCKELHVNITTSNILIKLKKSDIVYLQGELCKKCKINETVWSLDEHILQIHLEKVSESWWDCLVQTEPRLDFNKMDCSRPFYELSEETRARIEQLNWDQKRRQQGLPTSSQITMERTYQKTWNASGSSFIGTYVSSKNNKDETS